MHYFEYHDGELYCEDVPLRRIAETVGTPFYLYSHGTLKRHFEAFDGAFEGLERLVCYSAKANSSQAILKLFARLGSGLDIVSGGELFRGLQAGIAPGKIVYSGVGKRVDEIDYALQTGIRMLNLESVEELQLVHQRAETLGKRAPIAIRVNPDVDPQTHPYISTGLKKNKFGINTAAALEAYRLAAELPGMDIVGIDCHIGSQITQAAPFRDALANLMELIGQLRQMDIRIRTVDVGGGLGITYNDEQPPHPRDYGQAVRDLLAGTDLTLILEPGRVLVGNAGILVTRALYRKTGDRKEFVIVDAGMNDLLRPSLYDAYHHVQPVVQPQEGARIVADVVGPICESGDFLARDREMASVNSGDLLAVMSAGAYGYSMSSNYCSRLRVAEVMVAGDRFEVTRRRETYEDLVAGESVPDFLT
jgi:diaminopimelate decarboxylase